MHNKDARGCVDTAVQSLFSLHKQANFENKSKTKTVAFLKCLLGVDTLPVESWKIFSFVLTELQVKNLSSAVLRFTIIVV